MQLGRRARQQFGVPFVELLQQRPGDRATALASVLAKRRQLCSPASRP
jgi:hypothetical protein